jgi:hypothetical protein
LQHFEAMASNPEIEGMVWERREDSTAALLPAASRGSGSYREVVEAIAPLLRERPDDEPMFNQLSFERWLKQHKVPQVHGSYHFVPGDLRKFCEQMGDILQWDQSNKNYILTHGVSGVD